MQMLRFRVTGWLVLAGLVSFPGAAFANGLPTPTAPPTATPAATSVPRPTPSPAPPVATRVPPAAQPGAGVPAAGLDGAPAAASAGSGLPAAAEGAPTPGPASDAAPAAGPPADGSAPAEPLAYDAFTIWHGVVREGGAYRRAAPNAAAAIQEELDPGTPIRVDGWVAGSMLYPDVITWAAVDAEDGGGYIFGGSLAGVLPAGVPPAPERMQNSDATWIDVNLTLNVVTVYVSGQPVKMMLTSPGRPGHETDVGLFSVRSKLLSQTMSGPGYVVPGVPNVEYFYGGEALHGRYWTLPDVLGQTWADVDDNGQIQAVDDAIEPGGVNRGVAFGVPSSHGCLGVEVGAAAWLYGQTGYGTLVDVHV